MKNKKTKKIKPKFSIVIALAPWRNAEILEYIKKQDFPKKDFEIIIKKGFHVPDNRNNGIKSAKGEIILFLDDDGIIEKDFLKNVEEFFNRYKDVDILGGPQLTPKSDGYFARVNGYSLASQFACPSVYKRYKKSPLTLNANSDYLTGALMIMRKKVFSKMMFDRNIYPADDIHFINTARSNGFKVAYSPKVFIYHRRRANTKELIKQIFDYGKVRAKSALNFKSPKTILFFIPTLFIAYLLFLPTLTIINKLFLIPLALYILLSLYFSLIISIQNRELKAIFLLPIMFLIIHLAYGFGFFIGLIKRKEKPK